MPTSQYHRIADLLPDVNARLRAAGKKPLTYSALWPKAVEFSVRVDNKRLVPRKNIKALMRHLGIA